MTAAAALLLYALLPASDLDRGVTRLIGELELGSVAGFSVDADVALAVSAEAKDAAESRALERVIGGLARARLSAAGFSALEEQEAAEWLLAISAGAGAGKIRMHAELRKIDAGLWARPPAEPLLFATSDETIDSDDALKTLPSVDRVIPEVDPSEGLSFDGGPQRIATLSDRVLAIASCEVSSPFGEALFVLTRRSLHAYLYSSTGYARKAGSLDLSTLERAKDKTREPFGALACASNGKELALGSSELKEGHVVRVRAQNHELVLGVIRSLPGIPVGEITPGKWALARADGGRSRFLPVIELESGAKTLDSPVLELVIAGGRALAVTDRYRLLRYAEGLEAPVMLGTSGVGVSLVAGTPELAVATSSAAGDRDRLRLIPLDKSKKERRGSVEIDGAVHATAVAKLAGDARAVIAAAYRDGKTEIYAVPLKQRGGAR